MTKPAGTPRKRPEPRRRKEHSRLASLTLSPPTLRNEVHVCPASTWPSPPVSTPRASQTDPDPERSFYLGSTSYAAVFTDDRPLPNTVHQQPSERLSIAPSTSGSSKHPGTRHCQLSLGHSVISRLQPFSFFEQAVEGYFEQAVGSAMPGTLIFSILPQLREDLQQLTDPGNDVHHMYTELTKNTAKVGVICTN
jgi:hypothetical protein